MEVLVEMAVRDGVATASVSEEIGQARMRIALLPKAPLLGRLVAHGTAPVQRVQMDHVEWKDQYSRSVTLLLALSWEQDLVVHLRFLVPPTFAAVRETVDDWQRPTFPKSRSIR